MRGEGKAEMLGWAIAFVIAAVLVALMGTLETAHEVAALAKVLFWLFVIGFPVSLAMHNKSSRA